ncbi:MAG TPA: T9SS type A sorting domain-containing protein, partial [Caldithrix sp.]|nr:T9SS type A sorting domain-containing protein [Caldithrix sp.]
DNYLATAFSLGSEFTVSNSYFCQNNLDITASANSLVNCYSVTFSGNPTVKTQGNVNWYYHSTCGLGKSNAGEKHITAENILTKLESENGFDREKIKGKIDSLKIFLNENIKSLTPDPAKMTFRKLINLYKKYDMEEMKLYLQEVIANKNLQNLNVWAKRHLIDYYNYKKEFQNSLSVANEILLNENEADPIMVCETLFEKGMIYVYALPNKDEAVNAFIELVKKYPESPLAKAAKQEISRMDKDYQENLQTNTNSLEEKELTINNNPNPFNPVTTIQYNLPKDVNVVLEVFNIQGQKVKTLVNSQQKAGSYEVQFDGANLASGVYIYKIKAGNFTQSKRMLLIK